MRVDESLLEYRRRNNTWALPPPRPGLEREAYEVLRQAGRPLGYSEIALLIGERRGSEVSAVVLLGELKRASSLFLPLPGGRFYAISNLNAFDDDTDNLWYRLPPFDPQAPERATRLAARVAAAAFVARLPNEPLVIDAIHALFGELRKSWPTRDELRRTAADSDDPVERAGTSLVAQWSAREERPNLDDPADVESVVRQGARALAQMVEDSLRLVADQALRYAGRGVPFADLCHEGVLGLIRAAERFDPARARFSTYAVWWIRQSITRAIANDGRAIRIPVHEYENSPWLLREHIRQRIPLETPGTLRPILSLDALPERRHPRTELGETAERNDIARRVRSAMRALTERERNVLELRFGIGDENPLTLEEVGQRFGVTRERIRQIQAKAMRRLKHPSRKLRRLVDRAPRRAKRKSRSVRLETTSVFGVAERYVLARRFGLLDGNFATIADIARDTGSNAETVMNLLRRATKRMGPDAAVVLRDVLYGPRPFELRGAELLDDLRDAVTPVPPEPPRIPLDPPLRPPSFAADLGYWERVAVAMRLGLIESKPMTAAQIAEKLDRERDLVNEDLGRGLAKLPRTLLLEMADSIPGLLDDVYIGTEGAEDAQGPDPERPTDDEPRPDA